MFPTSHKLTVVAARTRQNAEEFANSNPRRRNGRAATALALLGLLLVTWASQSLAAGEPMVPDVIYFVNGSMVTDGELGTIPSHSVAFQHHGQGNWSPDPISIPEGGVASSAYTSQGIMHGQVFAQLNFVPISIDDRVTFGATIDVYVRGCSQGFQFSYVPSGLLTVDHPNGCGSLGPYGSASWGTVGLNAGCGNGSQPVTQDGRSFSGVSSPNLTCGAYSLATSITLSGVVEQIGGPYIFGNSRRIVVTLNTSFRIQTTLIGDGSCPPLSCQATWPSASPIGPCRERPVNGRLLVGPDINLGADFTGTCSCCEFRQGIVLRHTYGHPGWRNTFGPFIENSEDEKASCRGDDGAYVDDGYGYRNGHAGSCTFESGKCSSYSNADPPGSGSHGPPDTHECDGCLYRGKDTPGVIIDAGYNYAVEGWVNHTVVDLCGATPRVVLSGVWSFCCTGTSGGGNATACSATVLPCSPALTAMVAEPDTAVRSYDPVRVRVGADSITVAFGRGGSSDQELGVWVVCHNPVLQDSVGRVIRVSVNGLTLLDTMTVLSPRPDTALTVQSRLFVFRGTIPGTLNTTVTLGGQSTTFQHNLVLGVGDEPRAGRSDWSIRAVTNPMRADARFACLVARAGMCRVVVFDALGRRVRKLADGWLPAGSHDLQWDGRNEAGQRMSPGVYVVRLQGAGGDATSKFVVQR